MTASKLLLTLFIGLCITVASCIDSCNEVGCSGRGVCQDNGTCICNEERYTGRFCDCDNASCYRYRGKLCSGNGYCACGTCVCNDGWTGDECYCPTSTDKCRNPNKGGELCSGHGSCICGRCNCETAGRSIYSGRYCQHRRLYVSRCDELKPCVQCLIHRAGPLTSRECRRNCTDVSQGLSIVTAMSEENEAEVQCRFVDEDDCDFFFEYYYGEGDSLKIQALSGLDCPEAAD